MSAIFIAEVKTRSPHGWRADHDEEFLTQLALEHGDWVSIHTDSRWGGSMDTLGAVRRRMTAEGIDKPLLAKGIHETDALLRQALAVADFALVVGRWPDLEPDLMARVIFEPSHEHQVPMAVERYLALGARPRIMLNSRNLSDGTQAVDRIWTPTTVMERWAGEVWVVQASFIKTGREISHYADAFTVGSSLVAFLEAHGLGYAEVITEQEQPHG